MENINFSAVPKPNVLKFLNLTAISIFAVHLLCNIVFLSGFKVQNVVSHQTLWKNYRYGFTFIKTCQAF